MARDNDVCFEVPGVLPPADCAAWIARGEALGFERASIESAHGHRVVEQIRNTDRVLLDDPDAADALYARLRPHLPDGVFLDLPLPLPGVRPGRTVGLNPRLRLYRYVPGQRFRWHTDGCWRPSADEWSAWTLLLYLNDDFEGGATAFTGHEVAPKQGSALVFQHRLEHAGLAVTAGRKYVLRSDVVVRAV